MVPDWQRTAGACKAAAAACRWFYLAGFERDFPNVVLDADHDLSDDGPWLSCALPHSLGEMAIALVRHALGDALAQTCASVPTTNFHDRARAALQSQRAATHPRHTRRTWPAPWPGWKTIWTNRTRWPDWPKRRR